MKMKLVALALLISGTMAGMAGTSPLDANFGANADIDGQSTTTQATTYPKMPLVKVNESLMTEEDKSHVDAIIQSVEDFKKSDSKMKPGILDRIASRCDKMLKPMFSRWDTLSCIQKDVAIVTMFLVIEIYYGPAMMEAANTAGASLKDMFSNVSEYMYSFIPSSEATGTTLESLQSMLNRASEYMGLTLRNATKWDFGGKDDYYTGEKINMCHRLMDSNTTLNADACTSKDFLEKAYAEGDYGVAKCYNLLKSFLPHCTALMPAFLKKTCLEPAPFGAREPVEIVLSTSTDLATIALEKCPTLPKLPVCDRMQPHRPRRYTGFDAAPTPKNYPVAVVPKYEVAIR